MSGTEFRGAAAVGNQCSVRTLFLFSLAILGLVVAFHDYPEHDHFEFAHELLSKDAPAKNLSSELLSALDGLKAMSVLQAPSVQCVVAIRAAAEPILFSKGYRANWSGLAPPAVSVSVVPSLPSAVSRTFSAHVFIPAQDIQSVTAYSERGGLLS